MNSRLFQTGLTEPTLFPHQTLDFRDVLATLSRAALRHCQERTHPDTVLLFHFGSVVSGQHGVEVSLYLLHVGDAEPGVIFGQHFDVFRLVLVRLFL